MLPGRNYSFADAAGIVTRHKWLVIVPFSIGLAATSADHGFISVAGPVCGLLIGLALLAVHEYRDSSFLREQDVSSILLLPVLGRVSNMASERERRGRGFRQAAKNFIGYLLLVSSMAMFLWNRMT